MKNNTKGFTPSSKRGFTLIELLVVIAIIGILSSVVLASLNSARNKGADANIKQNLANVRAQGAIYFDDEGTYLGICEDVTVVSQIASAQSAVGSSSAAVICSDAAEAYAVSSPLKTGGYWCVDSTGVAKAEAAQITEDTDFACQ